MKDKLNELYALRIAREEMEAEAEAAANSLIPPDIAAEIKAVRQRYAARVKELAAQASGLEAEIKLAVKESGEKVVGDHLQAIPITRAKWDTRGLKGYAVANPEVLRFYSETHGVTIRAVGKR